MIYNILLIYCIKTILLIIISSSSNVNSFDSHWRCSSCFNETIASVGAEQWLGQHLKILKHLDVWRRLKISDRLLYIFWICLSILHYLKTSFNCKYLEIQLLSVHIILYERKIQITWKPSNFSYLRLKSLADASGELDSLSCFSRVGSIQGVISFLFNKIDNFFFKLI